MTGALAAKEWRLAARFELRDKVYEAHLDQGLAPSECSPILADEWHTER